MIPANALEMLLRATNPNIDWTATLIALGQLAVTVTTPTPTVQMASVPVETAPLITVPSETPTKTADVTTTKPSPQESSHNADQRVSPTQNLIVPLDISPLSAYKSPEKLTEKEEEDREEGAEEAGVITGEQTKDNEKKGTEESMDQGGKAKKDGETSKEKTLNETTKKQGLMTDEEFEALLEGAQRIGQEATGVAEGLDLATPVAGERDLSGEPINVPPQPEEKVETEEPKAVSGDPESDKGEKKMAAKPSKRKLTLPDDTVVEGKKPTRTSRRRLVRKRREKGDAAVASEAVEVSSGEDDAP